MAGENVPKEVEAPENYLRLLKDMKITEQRGQELVIAYKNIIEDDKYPNTIAELKALIKLTNKANELAFLCFTHGLQIGGRSAMMIAESQMPQLIKAAAMAGASMAAAPGEAPPTATAATEKKKVEEERMYG